MANDVRWADNGYVYEPGLNKKRLPPTLAQTHRIKCKTCQAVFVLNEQEILILQGLHKHLKYVCRRCNHVMNLAQLWK